jgi:catechol 2,3-dioxygenase-like lactoylglutathione lyase family enzyme
MKPSSFLGLRTVVYPVADLPRAVAWYARVLGIEPYFDQPFYAGFNVGGFELGLTPLPEGAAPRPAPKPDTETTAYWGVERMSEAWPRLLSLGATAHSEPQDVGEGIHVAAVVDPFGNLLGVIENPHFPNQA